MTDFRARGYIDLFSAYAGVCAMALIATHVFADHLARWTLVVELGGAACIAIVIALRVWRDRRVSHSETHRKHGAWHDR